jgi:PqqD family protein of HPr-rel-A system
MWRLTPGQMLVHHGWDGEYVLFNDLSGDTHLLDESALLLLLTLGQGPRAEAALQGATGADVEGLLADLEAFSLIEFVAC